MAEVIKNGRKFKNEQEYILFLEQQLAEKNNRTVSMKISEEKGTISIYGLGQYPVSLYMTQWETLVRTVLGTALPVDSPLGKLIANNSHLLTQKDDTDETKKQKAAARMADTSGAVQPKSKNSAPRGNGAPATA